MTLKNEEEKLNLLGQAWGHAQLKMFEEAVKDCEALVGLDKDNPASYVELAYYYEKSGAVEKAEDCYRYLMKRFPGYAVAYSNLGHIYQAHKKRPDIAMVLYQKALELDPEDIWAFNNIGTVLQAEKKWGEALAHYERAALLAKGVEQERACQIFHNLGWAYYRCKEYEDARKVFDVLLQGNEVDPSVYSDSGCVFYKMGRFEEALAAFEAALALCEDSRYYKKLCKMARRKQR